MNIAIVADLYFSIYSSFIPAMAAELSKRHRVFIFTPMARGVRAFREVRPYATVFHLGHPFPCEGAARAWSLARGAWQAARALRRERIDVAHVHLYTTAHWLWGWILLLARVPYAVTFHLAGPHTRRGLEGRLLTWQTDGLLAGRAAGLTAVSKSVKGNLKRQAGHDAEVLPLAVPPDLASRAARAARRGPYVLSFSGWNTVKGGDRLLWAFGEVAKKRAGVSLVLCGPGGRRFADMVRLLGLEDRVELNDHVPYAKALSLIRGCLFYAQISRYESFGMAILESMALGKTVLVSDTVGLGPYLRHGGNAHVVDPMDLRAVSAGLGKLVSDEAYRNRLARAAGETARELSWPRVAPGYEALYRRAAASA